MQTINERVFDLLENGKINWTVNKIQLTAPEGLDTPVAFGIYTKEKFLGTVGKDYTPIQNHELAKIFLQACDKIGLEGAVRSGYLGGKKKVYLQARLDDAMVAHDTVKRYLTAVNSHDGSTSTAFGTFNEVLACSNQFQRMFPGLKKVRHTGSIVERVAIVADNLATSIGREKEVVTTYKKMAAEAMDQQTVGELITALFNVSPEAKTEEISTQKVNQITKFGATLAAETKSHGSTVWGLFNAVTYYTNHVSRPEKISKEEYIMDKRGAYINKKAYELLSRKLVTA